MNKPSTCIVNGCDRDMDSRSLCKTHHGYLLRGRAVEEMKPIIKHKRTEFCVAPSCEKPANSRNLCHAHYLQARKGAQFEGAIPAKKEPQKCSFPECIKIVYGQKLCLGHYTQKARGKTLEPLSEFRAPVKHLPCSFDGCENNQAAGGYCQPHYRQHIRGARLKPISEILKPATLRDEQGRKWCSMCKAHKHEEEFHNDSRTKDKLSHRCKECMRAKARAYQASGEKRVRKYGITLAQFNAILKSQGYKCATCATDDPGTKGWCIDHDHACCPDESACGKCVRGILCTHCNCALGMVRDDPATLSRMIGYLNCPPAQLVA